MIKLFAKPCIIDRKLPRFTWHEDNDSAKVTIYYKFYQNGRNVEIKISDKVYKRNDPTVTKESLFHELINTWNTIFGVKQ